MKKLFVGAVMAAVLGVPGLSRAETPSAPWYLAAPDAGDARGAGARTSDARDYAAREKAAPQLAAFAGGDSNGLYIGTGALLVVLAIVLLVTLM